jgi:hypothetical protein
MPNPPLAAQPVPPLAAVTKGLPPVTAEERIPAPQPPVLNPEVPTPNPEVPKPPVSKGRNGSGQLESVVVVGRRRRRILMLMRTSSR